MKVSIAKKVNNSLCFLLISTLTIMNTTAQVGIGTNTPGANLDVLRGTAAGGTAQFRGTSNISHFNFGTTEDTYIRGGKAGSHVILNDLFGLGNVGIGTSSPGFPLNFANALGDKISLWGNFGTHYGFGVQGSLLQVHTDGAGSDIAFGYGSSGSFTERFRMKGNGAFVINGNSGQGGQVLQSTGGSSPQWQPLGSILQTHYRTGGNAFITSTYSSANFYSYNISLSTTSRLIISGLFNCSQSYDCLFGCSDGITQIDIIIDNNPVNLNVFMTAGGNSKSSASINNYFYDLPAGNHEIHFVVKYFTGSFLDISGIYSTIIVLPIQ
jgi:hypothetical protein